jgi:hypothetical protein
MKKGYGMTKVPRGRVANTHTTPSPVQGLNTRDPLAAMDPLCAVNFTNWIATPQGASVREGYRNYVTGLTGYVESLLPYNGQGAGSDKMFACANNGIYNVTTNGVAGAPLVTGLTNNKWTHASMAGTSSTYLVIANGVDNVRHYDGTTWTTWTTVATPSAPGQTSGVLLSSLRNPITHQKRFWFVQANSSKAYYFPVSGIGGAATAFDFGPAFPRGGTLTALASWSQDAGQGINNFLVAVSSEGDLVIYNGTDPSNAATFSISSTWRLGAPTTDACFFQFGGDQLYLSKDGLQPLSKYMQSSLTTFALTDAISPTISELSVSQSGLYGFQLHDVLSKNLLILNVPQIDPTQNVQLIFNTITKGWSLFTGWPAQCWATLNGDTYFGGLGKVCLAFSGYRDNANYNGSDGTTYIASCQQAANYFEKTSVLKRFTTARINLITLIGSPSLLLTVNTDFNTSAPASISAAVPPTSSLWGIATWGSSTWSAGLQNYNAWQTVSGVGYSGSIALAISVLGETVWVSTDWIYETGGLLG